jgi:hypothetical protein
MGAPAIVSLGLAAASANCVSLSQTPGGAGPLAINGSAAAAGMATLDRPRRLLFTCAGNETGKTATVSGTGSSGAPITESVNLPNASTVATTQDFGTVTQIIVSAGFSGAVTVGTSTTGSSRPIALDDYGLPVVSLQVDVSGTVTYSVEATLNDPNGAGYQGPTQWPNWIPHPNLGSQTTARQDSYAAKPKAVRLTVTAGTGSATLTLIQAGGARGG